MRPILLALPFILATSAASAEGCPRWQIGDLTVTNAWSRATIGTNRPGVFYGEIVNAGSQDDALTAISTPLATMPMLHETRLQDGVASMPHVMAVQVPAQGSINLEPGSFHGMLMGLTTALSEGESFPVTLTFRDAGEVTIEVGIAAMNGRGPTCLNDGD